MAELPGTRPSLLLRIRDRDDAEAWRQFVELYAPLIYGLARKRGLQDADAADLTQDVLQRVVRGVQNLDYDPQRGSFRSWLYAVVRNNLNNFLANQKRQHPGSGDTATQVFLENQPAREEETEGWDREYQERVFTLAAQQVRGEFEDSTWQAFWQMGVEGKSGEETAQALGMTVGAVYVAKSRVLARLKKRIQQLQEE